MTSKKRSTVSKSTQDKKAIVMNGAKKGNAPLIIATIVGIAAAVAMGLFFMEKQSGPMAKADPHATTTIQDGRIAYEVSMFADGKARHFRYADAASGSTIGYFILKSTDGVIRAAFDACDVCWRAGQGYYQEGSSMVCRNCGQRFESELVNEVQGGCNPAPLKRTIEGDQVVLQVADIQEGARFFNFAPKA